MKKNNELQLSTPTKPFLRWPGGKRWLIKDVLKLYPNVSFNNYFEPFLGGGAFFFSFDIKNANLSDINSDLINTYIQVRDCPLLLINELKKLKNDTITYEKVKKSKPILPLEQAARFLFLNRTSFGGIYRVNKKGEFNVPYGGKDRSHDILWTNNIIINASKKLQKTNIVQSDFESVIKKAKAGDLVYCDPIYTVSHNNNCFKRYNEKNFLWEDQIRLLKCVSNAVARGVKVIVSNAYHKEIKALYNNFTLHKVQRSSCLCPLPEKRKKTFEYLAVSDN